MSRYVYMKSLESQPERHDRGISLGSAGRCKEKLVEENVRPGSKFLEIGFRIESEHRSSLDSFLYLVARKEERA